MDEISGFWTYKDKTIIQDGARRDLYGDTVDVGDDRDQQEGSRNP